MTEAEQRAYARWAAELAKVEADTGHSLGGDPEDATTTAGLCPCFFNAEDCQDFCKPGLNGNCHANLAPEATTA